MGNSMLVTANGAVADAMSECITQADWTALMERLDQAQEFNNQPVLLALIDVIFDMFDK
jgi:hypothetical protein